MPPYPGEGETCVLPTGPSVERQMRDIHVSVVSHGQSSLVQTLLGDLGTLGCKDRLLVTVTCNIPENDEALETDKFPVDIMRNRRPMGFARNHNQAFRAIASPGQRRYFLVLNPDIRISEDVLKVCVDHLEAHEAWGLIAPTVKSPDGGIEDSARVLPTPFGLIRKVVGDAGVWPRDGVRRVVHPDWVAGMYMMFRASVFADIGGFDEQYFLYYEDVDICSRIWLSGNIVALDKDVSIVHAARRASRRNPRHTFMHLSSMLRFFTSPVYRKTRCLHQQRVKVP